MPYYCFQHPETQEVKDLFFHMNDNKIHIDENGTEWKRLFLPTLGAVDTVWDANSSQDFANKTRNKKGTLGEIMDKSKELSQQRESKEGFDKVKNKFYENYSKVRNGKQHSQQRKENLQKLKDNPIEIKIK